MNSATDHVRLLAARHFEVGLRLNAIGRIPFAMIKSRHRFSTPVWPIIRR